MNLALFDFDNTLTTTDCYSVFIYKYINRRDLSFRLLRLGVSKLLYSWGMYPVAELRKQASYVAFRQKLADQVERDAKQFVKEFICQHLSATGMEKLNWHQQRGDKVVLVSASIDPYLKPWCADLGIDLLCSELEVQDGKYTGRYQNGDCGGENKANRVKAKYDVSQFDKIYAYGDSDDDLPMLAIADYGHLNWQLIS